MIHGLELNAAVVNFRLTHACCLDLRIAYRESSSGPSTGLAAPETTERKQAREALGERLAIDLSPADLIRFVLACLPVWRLTCALEQVVE